MKLTKFQHQQCLDFMDELSKKAISKPFLQDLSLTFGLTEPKNTYLKNPLDLSEIRQKINDKKYRTIQDWECDVRLVFDNAIALLNSSSPIFAMAKDLQKWVDKKLSAFPRSEYDLWLNQFNRAHTKLQELVDSFPLPKK